MSMHSDDDDLSPIRTNGNGTNTRLPKGFVLDDDAFSDNDIDVPEFSPAAIREELAKSMARTGAADDRWGSGAGVDLELDTNMNDLAAKIGYAADPDASVSTFDIDAEPDSPPRPARMDSLASMYDVPLSSEPSQERFSADNVRAEPLQECDEPEEIAEADGGGGSDYPAVQIDLSGPTAQATEVGAHARARSSVSSAASQPRSESETHDLPPISVSARHQHAASQHELRTKPAPLDISGSGAAAGAAASASTSALPLPSSSSLPTPTVPQPPTPTSMAARHRPTRSVGPSMLDKVISKTRPPHLPPKPRTEDRKHLQDWEEMMRRSRATEEKRRKALRERRLAREKRIEDSIGQWEREIVPDWTVVHRSSHLRRLWWQGIPTKLRASMWQAAIGNPLALSKDSFKTCLSRAKRALASGSFPTTVLNLLENDIRTTLPSVHLFAPETGPLYQDLRDMLCAWVVSRSDEGLGYVVGVAKIAAMILINMAPMQGFIALRNLLERHCLRSFYGGMSSKDDVEAYYRIFDTLLADGMPKIYFNFKQHQISPSSYLPDWLVPLFIEHLPFEACARVWDVVVLEGDAFLYRAALAVLGVLEPRLFFPDKKELLELLKGENKAALEVARREGRALNNGKYEMYGVDEETLWERINSMDEWWRESTWQRLITRELPDI
ncbi:RabGAP/TBC [Epithele typhae]|uniref:RabGAP/TBC n=1 Tax=Epithele typhae TaxID=378194 RepID=UPI002007A0D7|nr:RabGAP/TBC [Epithele typhae]KAH9913326.1 RabGAP/TBC [Epithele typhae]